MRSARTICRVACDHADRSVADKQSKDPFARPSPGLVKRLAAEARYDAKRRRFDDDDAGPSDAERRRIMEAKAEKYERIRKGDLSGMTNKEIEDAALDVSS
jgi:large subunit ribosomal protein L24e